MGVINIRFLMVIRAAAAWDQLRYIHVFDGTALHAPLDESGSIHPTAQFGIHVVFAIYPGPILRYIPWDC